MKLTKRIKKRWRRMPKATWTPIGYYRNRPQMFPDTFGRSESVKFVVWSLNDPPVLLVEGAFP